MYQGEGIKTLTFLLRHGICHHNWSVGPLVLVDELGNAEPRPSVNVVFLEPLRLELYRGTVMRLRG